MRSLRKWCYEMFKNEHAIKFCCMVTPEDLAGNAEYIKMADFTVHVPGGSNNNNFANVDLIVELALRMKVDVSAKLNANRCILLFRIFNNFSHIDF